MTLFFLFLAVVAVIYKIFPPKNINYLYGYRTPRSMKTINNWQIANKHSANIMLISMWTLFAVSFICDALNAE